MSDITPESNSERLNLSDAKPVELKTDAEISEMKTALNSSANLSNSVVARKESAATPANFKDLHPDLSSISIHKFYIFLSFLWLLFVIAIAYLIPGVIAFKDYGNLFQLVFGILLIVGISAGLFYSGYRRTKECLHASWIMKTVTPVQVDAYHSTFDIGETSECYLYSFTF